MDLQEVEAVAGRLAGEFGIRPPKVTSGRVPRSMRLGIRAKVWWGRRLRLVIGPAAERLEPEVLEGELASAMAAFTLRGGLIARCLLTYGAAIACQLVLLALVVSIHPSWGNYIVNGAIPLWVALCIALYRGFVYRSDRKVADVLGASTLFPVLDAERRLSSNGWVHLWALPHADRRAERIAILRLADETAEDHRGLLDRLSDGRGCG
ncbi:hypothetical protein [Actinomadura sp. 7K534]|uniref:hypothetical protein n=1 Tax=Actinomadura sp. 7K534 TaxID=2530366 RepID=UPI001047DF5A|nr:hypothetical protein [Actinomadura sp. 7K534]TDB97215.1 hypothetical protein E1266_07345 [Actinomadura sp. 7K534]